MRNRTISFAGCKNTTIECISALIESGFVIDLIISLDPATAERNKVAGYVDISDFANDHGIERYVCDSYALTSKKDKAALGEKRIDVLLVIGWQRLIPEWLLAKLSIGAFGMHGSPRALPYGRGRSPMNWSLIQGRDKFITNLFKYNPGVDDGDIVATEVFDLNIHDTAKTCHYKNTLSMIKILQKNLDAILENRISLTPQLKVPPTYYPKRTAEDGMIFWDRDTTEIYNLIRAVTDPFPGAITMLGKERILIWEAQPFDTRLIDPSIPSGTVLYVFLCGDLLVKTGSDSILITRYRKPDGVIIRKGDIFNWEGFQYKPFYIYPTIAI